MKMIAARPSLSLSSFFCGRVQVNYKATSPGGRCAGTSPRRPTHAQSYLRNFLVPMEHICTTSHTERSLCHELYFPCLLTFSLLPACVIDHSPYIVDFRSAGWLPYVFKYRHALRAKYFGSRVCFFRMAPSADGERARQLANT